MAEHDPWALVWCRQPPVHGTCSSNVVEYGAQLVHPHARGLKLPKQVAVHHDSDQRCTLQHLVALSR